MRRYDNAKHSETYLRIMKKRKQRKICNAVIVGGVIVVGGLVSGCTKVETNRDSQQTAVSTESERAESTEQEKSFIGSMDWDGNEAYLLARIAMAEAESEDTEGKALVILTVLNRVWSDLAYFPDTIEEVIFQEDAFASTKNGRWERVEPNEDCWKALEMVQVELWNESRNATYYSTNEKATWHSRNLQELFTHGNHTFYKEVEK